LQFHAKLNNKAAGSIIHPSETEHQLKLVKKSILPKSKTIKEEKGVNEQHLLKTRKESAK
jgi:hypothetical protein